jgi:hypothetical protein
MDPLDALWHLLNFFAPAIGVALLASAMAKLIWRQALKAVGWWMLVVQVALAGAAVLLAGLFVFGRDGRMTTYLGLVLTTALVLWFRGVRHA